MVKKFNHHVLAIIFILFYVGSGILFGVAIKYQSENLILYWILKFLYVYLALIISIGLTVLWEEWVVFKLAKRSKSGVQNFYSAVLKANLVTLLVFMGAAAILMLPKRFASPDFLALFF